MAVLSVPTSHSYVYTTDELWHIVPVDIEELARRYGVRIKRWYLPDEFGAILQRIERDVWYLYLNSNHCLERQRFTIAHELSHVVSEGSCWPPTRRWFYESPDEHRRRERQADAAAGAYLMPGPLVRWWLEQGVPVPEMARRFLVSEEALRIRVEEIRADDSQRQSGSRGLSMMRIAADSVAR